MQKIVKRVLICLMIWVFFWSLNVIMDRKALNQNLIRFHVVANSDTQEDQLIKLQVRDAVLQSLKHDLESVGDIALARQYIMDNLAKIQDAANDTLKQLGVADRTTVTFCKEQFPMRIYDTFALPAGIYESLRITIGQGDGKNWWCVAFPMLCIPATTEGFANTAAGAGFSTALVHTLSGAPEYQFRFLLLDALGELDCKFYPKS